jgi:ribonuclease HI
LGAQVLITGDLKYHQALEAEASGLSLIDIPHDASEGLALSLWLPRLNQALAAHGAEAIMSAAGTDPWYPSEENSRQLNIPIMEEENMHNLYVDGGARGNPGPAGIGAVLFDEDGHKIDELASFIGEATNNVAEYRAMIAGLEMAIDLGVRRLMVYSDSELMVRQLKGSYKVKNEGLKPFHQQAKSLLSRLDEYELNSIPREKNADADRLVNAALDSTAR